MTSAMAAHVRFLFTRSPDATRPQGLPIPATRDGARTFLSSFNAKSFGSSHFLRLRTSRAIARKGSAPLRYRLLKRKNRAPPKFLRVPRA
jgi:hypothetical protein